MLWECRRYTNSAIWHIKWRGAILQIRASSSHGMKVANCQRLIVFYIELFDFAWVINYYIFCLLGRYFIHSMIGLVTCFCHKTCLLATTVISLENSCGVVFGVLRVSVVHNSFRLLYCWCHTFCVYPLFNTTFEHFFVFLFVKIGNHS